IGVLSNKNLVYDRLKNHGITIPQIAVFDSKDQIKEIKKVIKQEFNFPVIIKPAVGEACNGIIKVKKYDQIENSVNKVTNRVQMKILVQEYVEGINTSVSLISNGKNSYPISLNYQDIELKSSVDCSKYKGGITPFENPLKMKAFETAKKAVEVFDGIKGYVGLDLV
ncbi:MAG: ATP-grasp domain-containing protein, partial [Ignavibacteriaceae bacterium]